MYQLPKKQIFWLNLLSKNIFTDKVNLLTQNKI